MSPANLNLHIFLPPIEIEDLKHSCTFDIISSRNSLKKHCGSKHPRLTFNFAENHLLSAMSTSTELSDRYCYQLVDNP